MFPFVVALVLEPGEMVGFCGGFAVDESMSEDWAVGLISLDASIDAVGSVPVRAGDCFDACNAGFEWSVRSCWVVSSSPTSPSKGDPFKIDPSPSSGDFVGMASTSAFPFPGFDSAAGVISLGPC